MLYQIGNEEPFKLTPKSAKNLIQAVIETESTIVCMNQDTTCPPTYIIAKFDINPKKKDKFEAIIDWILEDCPVITGCG